MVEKVELPKGVSEKEAEKFLSSLKQDQPIVFKEIEVGPNSILRIQKTYYKGRYLYGIQKFWRETPTDEWQYGKAITFPDESIDDVIEGFLAMKIYIDKESE